MFNSITWLVSFHPVNDDFWLEISVDFKFMHHCMRSVKRTCCIGLGIRTAPFISIRISIGFIGNMEINLKYQGDD